MSNPTSKEQLLDTIRQERENWEKVLAQVGAGRMNLAGVTGDWSVKDIAAHIAAWESRVVAWLEAALAGTWPQPPPWPMNLDEDQTNEWIYKANRGRPVDDILAESRRIFETLIKTIPPVSDSDLTDARRFEWLGGNSLLDSIPGNSYEHYRIHEQGIREWLAQREPQPISNKSS